MKLISQLTKVLSLLACLMISTTSVAATDSPVGDWECAVSGADSGTAYLRFNDDNTVEGYALTKFSYGVTTYSGTWSESAGKIIGNTMLTTGESSVEATFTLTAKTNKSISGTITGAGKKYNFKGIKLNLENLSVLPGMFTGTQKQSGYNGINNFQITETEYPGLFTVEGTVSGAGFSYGYVGWAIIDSKKSIVIYIENEQGDESSLVGKFKADGSGTVSGKMRESNSTISLKFERDQF